MGMLKSIITRFSLFALAAVVLASCTVVVDQPPQPRPPRPGPIACTQEYAPVCGRLGSDTRTFGNACEARAEGYRILYPGECRRAEGPRFCTREYDPVCAFDGGAPRTFANACIAEAEGYRVIRRGECRAIRPPIQEEPRFCTREYRPVCARRGPDTRTFGNACEAEAADYRILYPGEC